MPVTLPRLYKFYFALLSGAALAAACAVQNATPDQNTVCAGLNCNLEAVGGPPTQDVTDDRDAPDATPAPTPVKLSCGVGSCVPDDPAACADHSEGPKPGEGGETDGGTGLDAGASGEQGALDAGADGGRNVPEVDGSYVRPSTPEAPPSQFACHVSLEGSAVQRSCMVAGTQGATDACTSSNDCAPGLGCVGPERQGTCLPFCCAIDGDTCAAGSYCAEQPLRDDELGARAGPLVPVCVRAANCSLSEPANCTGPDCVCKDGTVCTAVRDDGTTACLPPGESVAGQPCPCATGYHCSPVTATCVKTCDLDETDGCGAGICQSTPALPAGWGICVGAAPEEMTRRKD